MKRTFYPASDAALLLWATNYKERIGQYATELGMTQQEVDNEKAICEALIEAIKRANEQRNLLRGANDTKKQVNDIQGSELRLGIARHKKAVGYTDAIGKELEIIGSGTEFNPEEYKPVVIAITAGGEVVVKFKKRGVQGVNIYKRIKGSESWQLLSRATRSPYVFQPVLQNPTQPEQWEFRAYGVIKDKEVGQPSDILELLIGS
jgi:hypothetical protein